jgi:hypothetical protein
MKLLLLETVVSNQAGDETHCACIIAKIKCGFDIITRGAIFRPHMYKTVLFLLLLAPSWGAAEAEPAVIGSTIATRVLILENSTMPLPTAKATLIVGPLTRTNGVYVGNFKVRVFPYFFKSDWGRLAINVPDTALTAVNQGKTVAITGTSTSTKNGIVRHIEIRAMPKDQEHGTVSLWFMAGEQKMTFTAAYHFRGNADDLKQVFLQGTVLL